MQIICVVDTRIFYTAWTSLMDGAWTQRCDSHPRTWEYKLIHLNIGDIGVGMVNISRTSCIAK